VEQFKKLNATQLYCPTCGAAMPVRERLLLVLPDGNLFEYTCSRCGTSLGKRKETLGPKTGPPPGLKGRPLYM